MSNVLVATPLRETKINKIKKSGISHQMFNASIGNALYKREKITWNNLYRFAFSRGLAYLLRFTWRKGNTPKKRR